MNTSTVTLTGALTRDPEIRYNRAGTAVTTLSVSLDGTVPVHVECIGDLAENVALSLIKGTVVSVNGILLPDLNNDTPYALLGVRALDVAASLGNATLDVHQVERAR